MQHLQWLVPFLLSSTVLSTRYPGQIIAVFGYDNLVAVNAAYALYDKNPRISQVVAWLPIDSNNPTRGNHFVVLERITMAGMFPNYQLKRAPDGSLAPIDALPEGGRIQVVGHGRQNEQTNEMEISGLDALQLSSALQTLPTQGDIERVSLVGCRLGRQGFPEALLRDMSPIVKEVSSRNGIVGIDSSGRKVFGELTEEGNIVWRPAQGTITKTVIGLNNRNNVYHIPETISDNVRNRIELEETGTVGDPEYVQLSKDNVFNVICSVAEEHFQAVRVEPDWYLRIEKERRVRMLDNRGVESDERIKVRDIQNFAELTKEIKYWGEKGYEFPSYDKNTNTWTTTDSNGEPFGDKSIYYRYGDFVYEVKVQSGLKKMGLIRDLKPFRTTLKGVIVNEDPNGAATKNTELDLNQYKFGDTYVKMKPQTDNNFFPDTHKWMSGQHSEIGTTRTNAINGATTISMFTCEAFHDYRVHVTNKLSLDLSTHVPTFDRNIFYRSHPTSLGGDSTAREHGMRNDFYEGYSNHFNRFKVDKANGRLTSLVKQWTNAGFKDTVKNIKMRPTSSTSTESTNIDKKTRLTEAFKESVKIVMRTPHSIGSSFIQSTGETIYGPLFEGPYDARKVQEPQIESVNSEVNEYRETEDRSLPLKMSQAMLRDQLYVSKKISQAVEAREAASRKHFEINEDSIAVRGRKVTYEIYEPSNPSSRRYVETDLDESKMTSKHLMDEMHEQAQTLQQQQEEGASGRINIGLGIYGTVLGIKGAVESFERGDVLRGSIYLSQSLHGIGELSGLNQKIYRAAGKAVGKIASKAVVRVSETIGQVVGEDAGQLIAGGESELLSKIGDVGEAFKNIPIVGTAFGIYYIYEDIQRHTVIGYVDAGLDSLITVLGFLGPETEPFVIALTIIRLSIDTFYTDIKKELDSLPPDASIGQEVLAVLKGIDEAIFDIGDTITGGIFSASLRL